MRAPLLPPAIAAWPAALLRGDAVVADADAVAAALTRIRAGALFWPVPRAGARAPRALALDAAQLAVARAAFDDADILYAADPADVDPSRLEAVFAPAAAPMALWARLGGIAARDRLAPPQPGDAAALLARARGVSPWTRAPIPLEEAIAAQALLHGAARRGRGAAGGAVRLGPMSRWKRRCVAPFLTGPDGPPRPARGAAPDAVWGGDAAAPPLALRIEDGFLRSVGLGLRHTPPVSLTLHPGRPYFDASGANSFDAVAAAADFTPALLARAARLRAQIVALRLTKYNLAKGETPPDPGGREAVLVTGQVENDASIRLGAGAIRTNLALLQAARARHPGAFLLYKPHPDVLTGLRPGAVTAADVARLADGVVTRASAADCLDWADRVATITSLAGFEALLRGKAVTCFGRPFYAGWGLTDDADPPPRPRRLSLDALTAAALILYPAYIDPATRLPAPPEIAVAALARQAAQAGRPAARATRAWRDAASFLLARL